MVRFLQEKLSQAADGMEAVIAAIIRNKQILLGLRSYENAATVWAAPGGSAKRGEILEAAVCRETKEETGIEI